MHSPGPVLIHRLNAELRKNGDGHTVAEILQRNPQIESVLSIGPDTGLNESVLAIAHRAVRFTVLQNNDDAIQSSFQQWPARQITGTDLPTREYRSLIRSLQIEYLLEVDDEDTVQLKNRVVPNFRAIGGSPLSPLSERFDLCMAFHALPHGEKESRDYFRWIIHDVLNDQGFFLNEWGLFQRTKKEVLRVEHAESKDLPERRGITSALNDWAQNALA